MNNPLPEHAACSPARKTMAATRVRKHRGATKSRPIKSKSHLIEGTWGRSQSKAGREQSRRNPIKTRGWKAEGRQDKLTAPCQKHWGQGQQSWENSSCSEWGQNPKNELQRGNPWAQRLTRHCQHLPACNARVMDRVDEIKPGLIAS